MKYQQKYENVGERNWRNGCGVCVIGFGGGRVG